MHPIEMPLLVLTAFPLYRCIQVLAPSHSSPARLLLLLLLPSSAALFFTLFCARDNPAGLSFFFFFARFQHLRVVVFSSRCALVCSPLVSVECLFFFSYSLYPASNFKTEDFFSASWRYSKKNGIFAWV